MQNHELSKFTNISHTHTEFLQNRTVSLGADRARRDVNLIGCQLLRMSFPPFHATMSEVFVLSRKLISVFRGVIVAECQTSVGVSRGSVCTSVRPNPVSSVSTYCLYIRSPKSYVQCQHVVCASVRPDPRLNVSWYCPAGSVVHSYSRPAGRPTVSIPSPDTPRKLHRSLPIDHSPSLHCRDSAVRGGAV